MATYRKISGANVKSYSVDPDRTSPSGMEGKLYYNSSDGQFKFVGLSAAAGAAGGSVNTGRRSVGGLGTQTAALCFGGISTNADALSETYDGSSWTEGSNINTARHSSRGVGTTTAGLAIGGTPDSNTVESYNGSSWTETTEINTARGQGGASHAGPSTAALYFSGVTSPNTLSVAVESYDGSSWTETTEVNAGRRLGAGFGIQTAAVFAGGSSGNTGTKYAVTETWNGSAWTEVGDLNSARSEQPGACGITTAGFVFGGLDPAADYSQKCETWDGSSWTEVADLSTGRYMLVGAGTQNTSALAFAGTSGPPGVTNTEEWSYQHAFKKVTTS